MTLAALAAGQAQINLEQEKNLGVNKNNSEISCLNITFKQSQKDE